MYQEIKAPIVLECINQQHNKFYEVSAFKDDALFEGDKTLFIRVNFGRIGAKRSRQLLKGRFDSVDEIEVQCNKIVMQKIKKGYCRKYKTVEQPFLI